MDPFRYLQSIQAIIARRKSAAQEMIPDFEHVPGTRRTSALPSSPPTSPFKNIRKGIEDGEDTKSLITKMQETIEGMQRGRQSLGGRVSLGIGRGAGLLPSPIKLGQPLFSPRKDALDEPPIDAILEENEDEELGCQDETTSAKLSVTDEEGRSSSDSIHMTKAGVEKGLSVGSQNVPVTPSFKGVRELFFSQKYIAATPKMDGMRKLFSVPPEVATPSYAGLDSMLNLPEEDVTEQLENGDSDEEEAPQAGNNTEEDGKTNVETTIAKATPPTVIRKPIRTLRGTLTGSSTLADDEATPDLSAPKRRGLSSRTRGAAGGAVSQSSTIPEGAVVHRSTRLKKPVEVVGQKSSRSESKSVEVPEINFVSCLISAL